MNRAAFAGGPAEYVFPVEIRNDEYGKPLADPAFTALQSAAPGAKIVHLRRIATPEQALKAYPEEQPLPAAFADTVMEPGARDHDGSWFGHGDDKYLVAGQRPWYKLDHRSLIKVDLAALPQDAEILGAHLRLVAIPVDAWSKTEGDATLEAYALRQEWYEHTQDGQYACQRGPRYIHNDKSGRSVLWGKLAADDTESDRYPQAAGSLKVPAFPATGEKKRVLNLDITATVRQWQKGELPNHGLVLKLAGGKNALYLCSSEFDDYPLRPTLVVAYKTLAQP